MMTMDGRQGEGGGQVLRSALSLAMVTGQGISMQHIRGRRSRPGLLRQHLTAVRAATQISGARVRGDELRSESLSFEPGAIRHGDYEFAVGTAGSTTLVLQTLLPPLLMTPGRSRLVIEGGTHNPLAPSYDFLAQSYLPLLRRMGAQLEFRLEEPGFYPAGGGRLSIELEGGHTLEPLELDTRGELKSVFVEATASNIPKHVARRELEVIESRLASLSPRTKALMVRSRGPGNVLTAYVASATCTQTLVEFGSPKRSAEAVAECLVDRVSAYVDGSAAVDEHLADQLLLPVSLAGSGSYTTTEPSPHFTTNVEVIRRFLPVEVDVEGRDGGACRVRVRQSQ